MLRTFADKVIEFQKNLHYPPDGVPEKFQILNPFIENPETIEVMERFYRKYYSDSNIRRLILGINPGRHGAGTTGVPFTDTKRLGSICGIKMHTAYTHEISSVFVYDMIAEYGGAEKFYRDFYINSPFPLAIIRPAKNGKWVNANYYDHPALFEKLKDFMLETLKKHINKGIDTREVFVLGKKNADFIKKLNEKTALFEIITTLEHPRYIQQYRSKEKQMFIDKYLMALKKKK